MAHRFGRLTVAGRVVFGIGVVLVVAIVVGLLVGAGTTVVVIAAAILAISIFILVGQPNSKMNWKSTPRDEEESRDYRG